MTGKNPPLEIFSFPLRVTNTLDFSTAFTKSSRKNTIDVEMTNKLQKARDALIKNAGKEEYIEKATEYLSLFQGLVNSPVEELEAKEDVPLLSSTATKSQQSKL